MAPQSCNVFVVARFRPMNSREKEISTKGVDEKGFKIQYGDTDVAITGGTAHGEQKFALDKVFDPDCMQKDIFDHVAQRTIDDILSGFNGTIFAYGQTGSGKTFTMMGPDISGDPALNGIIPRSSLQIFDHIEGDDTGTEFVIKCSYMEIYNEQIHDLRVKGHDNLQIREHPTRGIYVDGLSETPISSPEDIVRLINIGAHHRATASTNMNAVSSRSHSLFVVTVMQRHTDGSSRSGRLNLVDLAGSEKVGKTGATGQRLEEAKGINLSLSALGNCIKALTEDKVGHVPFRDSKLTRILQDSLGGNTKTTLLVACSPHADNCDETISTLRFAQRAKQIKNAVKANVNRSNAELEKLVQSLTDEVERLKKGLGIGESDETLRAELEERKLDHKKEIDAMEAEADSIKERTQALESRLLEVRAEQHSSAELEAAMAKARLEKASLDDEIAELKAKNDELSQQIDKLEADSDELQSVVEARTLDLAEEKKRTAAAQQAAAKLRVQVETLGSKLTSSEALESITAANNKQIALMNEQNAAYSREQSAAKAEADRLRSAEQAKQREIEKAKARQEELLAKNTSLRAQLGDVLAQLGVSNANAEAAQKDAKQLQQDIAARRLEPQISTAQKRRSTIGAADDASLEHQGSSVRNIAVPVSAGERKLIGQSIHMHDRDANVDAGLQPDVPAKEHLPEDGIVERMRAFYVAEREKKAPALAAAKPLGKLAIG